MPHNVEFDKEEYIALSHIANGYLAELKHTENGIVTTGKDGKSEIILLS